MPAEACKGRGSEELRVIQFANNGDNRLSDSDREGCRDMTTSIGNEDPFEEVERGIEWLERLESMKARQDREGAIQETIEYVNVLREVISILSGDAEAEWIEKRYGRRFADVIDGVRGSGTKDPWEEYLKPALLDR